MMQAVNNKNHKGTCYPLIRIKLFWQKGKKKDVEKISINYLAVLLFSQYWSSAFATRSKKINPTGLFFYLASLQLTRQPQMGKITLEYYLVPGYLFQQGKRRKH